MSDDPFDYVSPPLRNVREMVAIPRARYDALMAAAAALTFYFDPNDRTVGGKALAALRAAGIGAAQPLPQPPEKTT